MKFDLRNTKVGSVKWTKTGPNFAREVVPVDIIRARRQSCGTLRIHGVIRPTGEKITFSTNGHDYRFWGSVHHTKEEAEKLAY